MKLNYTIYKDHNITIFNQGEFYNIQFSDKRYRLIEQLLSGNDDHSPILKMVKPELIFENEKHLTFQNDRVFYKGDLLPVGVADAVFKGILDQSNIGKYLYLWERLKEAVSKDNSEYWKFQANKLFFNIYPFEEFLLCLNRPDSGNMIKLDNLIYLKSSDNREISNLFWKRLSLNEIMQELGISGNKLKRTLKSRMIENNELDPAILEVIKFIKDKVSHDHLIEILSAVPKEYFPKITILNKFLEVWAINGGSYNVSKIKNILLSDNSKDVLALATTLAVNSSWENFIFPDTIEISEIVSFIEQESLKIKYAKYTINYLEDYPNLQNISFKEHPEIQMVIPNHGTELISWGQIMGNCIGGETYMKQAKSGNSLLLGFKINDVLTFTLEIKKQQIQQFEERKMASKHFSLYHSIIRDELLKNGIITRE